MHHGQVAVRKPLAYVPAWRPDAPYGQPQPQPQQQQQQQQQPSRASQSLSQNHAHSAQKPPGLLLAAGLGSESDEAAASGGARSGGGGGGGGLSPAWTDDSQTQLLEAGDRAVDDDGEYAAAKHAPQTTTASTTATTATRTSDWIQADSAADAAASSAALGGAETSAGTAGSTAPHGARSGPLWTVPAAASAGIASQLLDGLEPRSAATPLWGQALSDDAASLASESMHGDGGRAEGASPSSPTTILLRSGEADGQTGTGDDDGGGGESDGGGEKSVAWRVSFTEWEEQRQAEREKEAARAKQLGARHIPLHLPSCLTAWLPGAFFVLAMP